MKKYALLLLICFSCAKEAQEKRESTNSNYDVELLFEVDGCKMYRFSDGGYYRYFTNCKGSVEWTEKRGKSTVPVNVQTN